jgi:hypothetical protein
MANQYSIQDQNRFPALLVHSGTANTAETIRVVGQTDGAINVYSSGGTLPTGASTSAKQDTQTTLLQGIAGLLPVAYDYITYTSGSTTDTYVFKTGGSGGATVKTITITFVDTTKKVLSTVGAT